MSQMLYFTKQLSLKLSICLIVANKLPVLVKSLFEFEIQFFANNIDLQRPIKK